jgi:hypothetical protein
MAWALLVSLPRLEHIAHVDLEPAGVLLDMRVKRVACNQIRQERCDIIHGKLSGEFISLLGNMTLVN